jgi:hypothetical protein
LKVEKASIAVLLALGTFLLGISNSAAETNLGRPGKTVPPLAQPAVRNTVPVTRPALGAYQPVVVSTEKLTVYGKPPIVIGTEKLTVYGKPPIVIGTEKLTVYGQP